MTHWLNFRHFEKCAKAILGELVKHPPGYTIEQLANRTDYEVSGSFKNSISTLRTAGVLVGKNAEMMRASDELLEAAMESA